MKKYNTIKTDWTLDELADLPDSKEDAIEADSRLYYDPITPCKRGHMAPRYASSQQCLTCVKERLIAQSDHIKEVQKNYYNNNKQKKRGYRVKNYEYIMWQSSKHRAKRKGLEFTIEQSDIKIPEHCPVLGIKLERSSSNRLDSPSLDRFDNSKGYTKENIRVISNKANSLKSNGTVEDLEKILAYMKGEKIENPQNPGVKKIFGFLGFGGKKVEEKERV